MKSIIARVRTTTSSSVLMRCENPQGVLKLRTMTKTRQRKRRDQSRRGRRRFHHHQPEIHLPSLLVSFHLSFLPDQNGILLLCEAFACGRHGTAYRRCFGELTNTGFLNFVDSISAAVCLALTSIFGTGLRSPVPASAFAIVLPPVTAFFFSPFVHALKSLHCY